MSSKKSVSEALEWLDAASMRFRPKTSEALDRGLSLAREFEALSLSDRLSVQEHIPASLHQKLFALSGYMAEAAINDHDAKWIGAAICLHLIEDFGKDYRENFRYLVLVAYAAKKVNVDLKKVIDSLLPFASERASSYLIDFSHRDNGVNNLSSFGVKEEVIDNKSRFVPM